MHRCRIFLVFLLLAQTASAQPGAGYQKDYTFLHSGNLVADKNFYLITVIDKTPALANILAKDERLHQLQQDKFRCALR